LHELLPTQKIGSSIFAVAEQGIICQDVAADHEAGDVKSGS
jgi:hypothetical protein